MQTHGGTLPETLPVTGGAPHASWTDADCGGGTSAGGTRPLRITVLRGGPSAEREVSLKSGRAVAAALRLLGHRVFEADISPADLRALDEPADVVFIALHGTFGEDGQLQAILDERGIAYCGCGAEASALAMDKVQTKARCVAAGIPTPRFDVVRPGRWRQACANWSPPVVVKPVAEGSSVGCIIVREAVDFIPAVQCLVQKYGQCLVEQYVRGLELTVGVLDGQALPPIWIRTPHMFYDYDAKYSDDRTEYLFEIPLPPAVLQRVRELSLRAFAALGCRDFGRVDWIVDAETGEPSLLEINTIPGFTDHSLLPKAAAQAGVGFAELCQRLVLLALRRCVAAERAAG
ncbi:MAG: D-alanine--D-alanine ligase [Phycisphaerae bacterium]|nr:D-alanine--D-alanine ligase [Phycisphaerae bacterium]